MYANKLVAAIKVDGKILREIKDSVYIPFGSEYEIFLQNLAHTRCKVSIDIDGTCVTPLELAIDPDKFCILERPTKINDNGQGNRFKFIQLTESIEKNKGVNPLNGLIRISFEFEREASSHLDDYLKRQIKPLGNPDYWTTPSPWSSPIQPTWISSSSTSYTASSSNNQFLNYTEKGITVPGSKSNQTFIGTSFGETDGNSHSMVFKLVGEVESKKIEHPVDVSKKQVCSTCGRKNKALANFCSECGTSLQLF